MVYTCIACGSQCDLNTAALSRGRSQCSCGQPIDPDLPRIALPNKKVSNTEAKAFLEEFANLGVAAERKAMADELASQRLPSAMIPPEQHEDRDVGAAIGRFLSRFSAFFHEGFPTLNWWSEAAGELHGAGRSERRCRTTGKDALMAFRNQLRFTWDISDLRKKEWRCFWLRRYAQLFSCDPRVVPGLRDRLSDDEPPSEFSPIDQCLLFFIRNARTARHCADQDCSAPYFFASRPKQKYCSTACAKPAQKAYKQRWWKKHGKAWRKNYQLLATGPSKGRGRKKKSKA
jgi:hypothetical protein